jgi:hypothetical protein
MDDLLQHTTRLASLGFAIDSTRAHQWIQQQRAVVAARSSLKSAMDKACDHAGEQTRTDLVQAITSLTVSPLAPLLADALASARNALTRYVWFALY